MERTHGPHGNKASSQQSWRDWGLLPTATRVSPEADLPASQPFSDWSPGQYLDWNLVRNPKQEPFGQTPLKCLTHRNWEKINIYSFIRRGPDDLVATGWVATGFTYLGCPNVEPALTLPQPTCTHRGVTLLFLEPLKRYSFHCLTVVSARKLFLCCQRDHFHLLSYIVTKMQHLKQRKPLIGCSSHLYYLLL